MSATRSQRILFIVIDVILAIAVIVAVVFLLYYRNDLKQCEENESLYCPQFTCPLAITNAKGQQELPPAVRNGPGQKVSILPFINT